MAKNYRNKKDIYRDKTTWIGLAIIILLTIISFSPIFNADFVNWDDTVNILDNPNVKSLSWAHIKAIFTEHVIGNYNPLTIFSFALEYSLVGENATLFHVDNLLLHLLNVCLVFFLGRRLKLGTITSLFLSALYALHPMRVESVAWITERKDVLYAAFYFFSIHTYITYKQNQKTSSFVFSLIFMVLAALSKIQAVTLPLSLLLIDMYRYKNNHWWKWIKEKIPFFIISLIFGLVGIYFLRQQGSLMSTAEDTSFLSRIILGFYSIGVYVIKSVFPYEMVPIYPYSQGLEARHYIGSGFGLVVVGGMIYSWFRGSRYVKLGLFFFLVNIIFLIQIVSAGQGLTADRFTYVPYFGLFFIIAVYWQKMRLKKRWFSPYIWVGMAIIAVLIYSFMTFQQTQVWKNSETLWTHQLNYYNRIPLPYANRANYLRDNKRYEEALQDYNKSLELKPRRALTRNSRGKLYFTLGKYKKALQDYNIALEVDPNNAEYLSNKGAALGYLRRFKESLTYFNKSIQQDPDYYQAYANRAYTHYQLGNMQEAYSDFQVVTKYIGTTAQTYSMMARISLRLGQNPRALQEINAALLLKNEAFYHTIKARALYRLGRQSEARQEITQAERMGATVSSQIKQRIFGGQN